MTYANDNGQTLGLNLPVLPMTSEQVRQMLTGQPTDPLNAVNRLAPMPVQTQVQSSQVPLSLWFDMQPDAHIAAPVPLWARELAQAHADGDCVVLAHSDSAYARSRLLCEIVRADSWAQDDWCAHLRGAIRERAAQRIILMLPYRASTALWAQWSLLNLDALGAGLDGMVGLLQGCDGWQQTLSRSDADRWLILDRVMGYNFGAANADFVAQMRAFNPLTQSLCDDFGSKEILLQPLNAYHKYSPLARSPLKKDDLNAFDPNKVVYFATSKEMDGEKLSQCLTRWRAQWGGKMVRMWASIRVAQQPKPLLVTAVHHLWANYLADTVPPDGMVDTRVWMLGSGLDAVQLQADFERCATG